MPQEMAFSYWDFVKFARKFYFKTNSRCPISQIRVFLYCWNKTISTNAAGITCNGYFWFYEISNIQILTQIEMSTTSRHYVVLGKWCVLVASDVSCRMTLVSNIPHHHHLQHRHHPRPVKISWSRTRLHSLHKLDRWSVFIFTVKCDPLAFKRDSLPKSYSPTMLPLSYHLHSWNHSGLLVSWRFFYSIKKHWVYHKEHSI